MAANYQHASDSVKGMPPYSGVIRADGRWVPCAAGNEDWAEYLEWAKDEKNQPDPYRSPEEGGVVIKLQEGEVAVGSMLDSMPPEPEPTPVVSAPEPSHRVGDLRQPAHEAAAARPEAAPQGLQAHPEAAPQERTVPKK
jgi:hypothetical protein